MIMEQLVWLRPGWLWILLPLWAGWLLYWFRLRGQASAWDAVVDTSLQEFVMEGGAGKVSAAPIGLLLAWTITVLMLAGPVWKQQEVPVFQAQQAEVILFDLSRSMLSTDLAPDRLTRARFKLADLLDASDGRQTALIGFAERPYVISPLTEDSATIKAFLPALHPEVMPVQGSRLDLAIDRAVSLLDQSGIRSGHIVYIGDTETDTRDLQAAQNAADAGHRLSVIGVGTEAGKPLTDAQGRFLRAPDGTIVVPQLDVAAQRALAGAGKGLAVTLSADNSDLLVLDQARRLIAVQSADEMPATEHSYWIEYSPWLLWPMLLSALLLFRKGLLT